MKRYLSFFALILCSSAFIVNEGDILSDLRTKAYAFNKKFNRAKIDLFFNQPKYVAGDTVRLRTLYLTAADLKPVAGKNIIYLELFDQHGKKVTTNQLLSVDGFSSNSFSIPKDILPGIYSLVAYSDWMRNYGSSLYYNQKFIITGPESLKRKETTDADIKLSVYPEGGSLVANLENNLLLKVEGVLKTYPVSIKSGSEVVASSALDDEGMAEFKITPQLGMTYFAEVNMNGRTKRVNLPEAKSEGFSIHVAASTGSSALGVSWKASTNTDRNKRYFLVLTNARGIIYSKPLEILNDEKAVDVSLPEDLPSGMAQLLIIDESMTRWATRMVMIQAKPSYSVALKQSRESYGTREEVSIDVEVTDKTGNVVEGQFSTRIFNQELFGESAHHLETAYNLLVNSDLDNAGNLNGTPGTVELNRFLIGQSCPWLDWDKIVTGDSAPLRYSPRSNLTLTGKVVSLEDGKSVSDSTQIMFFLQKQIFGYEVYTNNKGEFVCPILFDFDGNDQIFFSAMHRGKDVSDIAVQLDKGDTSYSFNSIPWTTDSRVQDAYGAYCYKKKIVDESYSFFSKPNAKRDSVSDPNAAIEDELQGADITFKTNDYIIFPTMPDLVREVLRSVDYRKIHGRDVIRMYMTGKRPTNSANPLYVIDGVMTKRTETFIGLKPADIITIKLIKDSNKLQKFGSLGSNGVILVRTKNAAKKQTIHQENTFPIVGMSPKSGTIAIASVNHATPDLRPFLLWSPKQALNSEGKSTLRFTTSDDVGSYKIEIRGITEDGVPFSAEQIIQVKFHQP